jgi:hypothetical protein
LGPSPSKRPIITTGVIIGIPIIIGTIITGAIGIGAIGIGAIGKKQSAQKHHEPILQLKSRHWLPAFLNQQCGVCHMWPSDNRGWRLICP